MTTPSVSRTAGPPACILLIQCVGNRFSGFAGLTMTVPIAALTTAALGIGQAARQLPLTVVTAGLVPSVPRPTVRVGDVGTGPPVCAQRGGTRLHPASGDAAGTSRPSP